MRFLGFSNHEKRAPRQEISMCCSTFSRSGWSVVRSASPTKGSTSETRPSPHLHKVPTRSNKASPRTFQTAIVFYWLVLLNFVYRVKTSNGHLLLASHILWEDFCRNVSELSTERSMKVSNDLCSKFMSVNSIDSYVFIQPSAVLVLNFPLPLCSRATLEISTESGSLMHGTWFKYA
jgi:hypothetical protein